MAVFYSENQTIT